MCEEAFDWLINSSRQYNRICTERICTETSDLHLISSYNITGESNIKGYENKGNDQYVKEPLIDKSIPLDNTIGYVHRTVRRICMLILGCRGLIKRALRQPLKITLFYYITDSTLCQYEANPMFWLANRASKMSPSCPLEIYRWDPVHDKKFLGANLKKSS